MEYVTPEDVALCMLLHFYLCPDDASDPPPHSRSHQLLGEALLQETRRWHDVPSPNLVELLQRLQDHICGGRGEGGEAAEFCARLKADLGKRLSELDTPDCLVAFFAALEDDALSNCTVTAGDAEAVGADAGSALGLHLRRVCVRYAAMPFEAICNLLAGVHAYFDAAVATLQGGAAPAAAKPGPRPRTDLHRFFNARLAGLARQVGSLPRAALEGPLDEPGAAAPCIPQAHLARHTSSLLHRDHTAALDHLHRFFDLCAEPGSDPARAPAAPAPPPAPPPGQAAPPGRGVLQSAALSLASAHAALGHVAEALQALNEAVRIAQQAGDDACLAHALATLCSVLEAATPATITADGSQAGPTPAARHTAQLGQLLHRCLRRSEELRLPHLAAFSRLAQARLQLLHPQQAAAPGPSPDGGGDGTRGPGSGPPCAAVLAAGGALRDVCHLHMAARLAAAVPSAPAPGAAASSARALQGASDLFAAASSLFGPSMAGQQAAAAAEVERLAAGAHLLRAAAWELGGSRQLSLAHSLSCLDAYADVATADHRCTALAQLATSLAASHGYAAAQAVLAAADRALPHSQSGVLAAARLAVAHDRALRRRDLHAAADLAARMAALAPPTDATDIRLRLEAEERVARTLLAAGRHEEAAAAARMLFATASGTGQPLHATRVLLLLARVHAEAGAPLCALPHALAAAHHARALHADALAAEAAVQLARLWSSLGRGGAQRAAAELEAAMPFVLAHGSAELAAGAQAALAEALMAAADGPEELRRHGDWALSLLEEAERLSSELEDGRAAAHAAYLRALLLDGLGRREERDAAAAAFGALSSLELASAAG